MTCYGEIEYEKLTKVQRVQYASNVELVQKKDRSLRFDIDLRYLNNLTIRDSHVLPSIKEAIHSSGVTY